MNSLRITSKRKIGESLGGIFGISDLEELKPYSDEDRVLELLKTLKFRFFQLWKNIQKKEKARNKVAAIMEFEDAAKVRPSFPSLIK